jgi:sigma-B regulation protein RsbU (phosphoserine phosphatase)
MDSPSQPPKPQVRWRHSLRTRMLVGAVLSLAALLGLLGTLFYLGARAELVTAARKEVDGLTQQSARSLAATLDSVQVSGRTLAASAGAVGAQPFNLRALLEATLTGDSDIAGAMIVLRPRSGKQAEDPGFVWYIRRAGDKLVEQSAQDLGYDYRVMPWYQRTMRTRQAWWSEPYANSATGGELFTTYNLPVMRPGDPPGAEPTGMVSVDVPVRRLRDIVRELPDNFGVQATLLSPEGLFVLNPDPALNLRRTLAQQVQRARPDLAPLVQAMAAGETAALFEHRAPDGQVYFTRSAAVGKSGWTFVLSASRGYVLAGLNRLALWVALGAVTGLVLWWVLMRRFASRLTRPIEDLTEAAAQFRRGDFDFTLPHVQRHDEVGVMARAFDIARGSIRQQLDEIGQMTAARERMQSELQIARDIQLAMLPSGRTFDTAGSHLETCARLEPAKMVGGDFYHFFETAPGQLWFVIGDVSDKGVPAALFMARTVSVLEVAARRHTRPDGILIAASRRLAENNDTCMFATVLCGLINVDSGDFWLSSAGHERPLLLDADRGVQTLPLESGPPLGIEEQAHYPLLRGRLEPGQTLFGYTDGVTDALDEHAHAYGLARLHAALRPGRSAAEQCAAVVADLHRFTGEAEPFDDITLLAIRLRREPGEAQGT